MKLELHFLQNFAPSNLNRDDTGAPKDCEFGGVRRARISSQCLKRAIRQAFEVHQLLGESTADQMAARTKRLVTETERLLVERGKPEGKAAAVVAFALQAAKLKVDDENKTQYLLFVPRRVVKELADLVERHWAELADAAGAHPDESEKEGGKKTSKKAEKKAAKDAVPKDVAKALSSLLADVARTPDLALFGRMIADNPEWNTDAACQVAHAISTNKASMEFDFYTAVDDLRTKDASGSDMMGTVPFQSACFYRYACLDVDALRRNLASGENDGDALAAKTVDAFLRASALAIPTGKQNSMAAQNRPSYLLAVVRDGGAPQSLANAFVRPVRPEGDASLVEASVDRLEAYLDKSLDMWGDRVRTFACAEVDAKTSERPERCPTFDAWVKSVVAAAAGGAA